MLKGSTDISHLPYEWRRIVNDVAGMRLRAQFGVRFKDEDLSEQYKLAIEVLQNELNKRPSPPQS